MSHLQLIKHVAADASHAENSLQGTVAGETQWTTLTALLAAFYVCLVHVASYQQTTAGVDFQACGLISPLSLSRPAAEAAAGAALCMYTWCAWRTTAETMPAA